MILQTQDTSTKVRPMTIIEIEAVWSVVGKFAAILAVIVAIVKGVQYLNGFMPTTKLNERVTVVEKKQEDGLKRLEHLENQSDDMKRQMSEVSEGIRRIGRSQISLLNHSINGNGVEKMKEEVQDLTDYFIER